jgi:NAD(P)-dependent dehydrogenase (short-subunit alcohol dehydrogenase family)
VGAEPNDSLRGRVALVTGAGRGLGRAIAEELAHAGADVAVAEIDADAARRAADELSGLGVRSRAYPLDVVDADRVDAVFDACARDFGRLDVLVNNAGLSRVGPHTQDVTNDDWNTSIGVMQSGVFYCMRAASRIMLPQRSGSVVNIASIRGFSPNPGRIAYCAAKAAVIMMTRVAAGEWGPHGVRVNAVAPGVTATPMWEEEVARGVLDEQHYLDVVPLAKIGRPDDVGRLCVFLASDRAAYITGACVAIDGGLTSVPIG